MNNERGLSIKMNMSLGFIPLIITMILSEFIAADIAIYIGTGTGLALVAFHYFRQATPPPLILSITTVVLGLFALFIGVVGTEGEWAHRLLSLTLETAIILPLLALYLNKERFQHRAYFTFSCIRILFIIIAIHFALTIVGLIATRSLDNGYMWFMLHIAPIIVFILSTFLGELEIRILKTIDAPEYVPIVTPKGEVIGKVDKSLAEEYKNEHTNPIVRVAVISHDMLFLSRRSEQRVIDKGRMDIPLETYLLFEEEINNGVERLLKETFPNDWEGLKPKFSIKYKFKNEDTDRIVYLFILDLGTDDAILCDPKFTDGKLWTFQQIDLNLGQDYFSEMFENEYDHLRLVIETIGIYKES